MYFLTIKLHCWNLLQLIIKEPLTLFVLWITISVSLRLRVIATQRFTFPPKEVKGSNNWEKRNRVEGGGGRQNNIYATMGSRDRRPIWWWMTMCLHDVVATDIRRLWEPNGSCSMWILIHIKKRTRVCYAHSGFRTIANFLLQLPMLSPKNVSHKWKLHIVWVSF